MMPVRDVFAVLLTALIVIAVAGAGYVMRERRLTPHDMTDISSSHHRANW